MKKIKDITCFLLAGGKSSRFGSDKALIKFGNISMIEIMLAKVKDLFETIYIITNNPEKFNFIESDLISDIIRNIGPLGGIHSGLSHTNTQKNFFISCDLPFMTPQIIEYLCSQKSEKQSIIPYTMNRLHPLTAIYDRNCLPVIESLIEKHISVDNDKNKRLSMTNFLSLIEFDKLILEDFAFYSRDAFFNMNTPDDYRIVKEKIEYLNF